MLIYGGGSKSSSFILHNFISSFRPFALLFEVEFTNIHKMFFWDFDWDCTEPVDKSEENLQVCTTEFSSTCIWYIIWNFKFSVRHYFRYLCKCPAYLLEI